MRSNKQGTVRAQGVLPVEGRGWSAMSTRREHQQRRAIALVNLLRGGCAAAGLLLLSGRSQGVRVESKSCYTPQEPGG